MKAPEADSATQNAATNLLVPMSPAPAGARTIGHAGAEKQFSAATVRASEDAAAATLAASSARIANRQRREVRTSRRSGNVASQFSRAKAPTANIRVERNQKALRSTRIGYRPPAARSPPGRNRDPGEQ